MKTQPRGIPLNAGRFTSSAVPALVCCVLLSGAFSSGIAQQRLTPSGTRVKQPPSVKTTLAVRKGPAFDYSGIGGSVYATGLGNVTVTVHDIRDSLKDSFYPYPITVFLSSDKEPRLLGSNYENRITRLGRLERGEIRLVANCPVPGDGVVVSGSGRGNPDGLPRSRVKQVQPGVVEVYFELTIREGTHNDRREQHWYKDFKMTFTGAVTADPGELVLLEKINDPDPRNRQAARDALKIVSPLLASQAGVR